MVDSTATVVNPRDEDPLSNKNKDTFTQYMYGRVSVSDDRLAIGLVFRDMFGEASYCDTTRRMLNTNDHTRYNYTYLHNEFDRDTFQSDLCTKFTKQFH